MFLSPFQRALSIAPCDDKACLYLTKLFVDYLAMQESLGLEDDQYLYFSYILSDLLAKGLVSL